MARDARELPGQGGGPARAARPRLRRLRRALAQVSKSRSIPARFYGYFTSRIFHWTFLFRNIGVLSESNTVYAIDLLGFGASDKPAGFSYTMETWAELILEFLDEVVKRPTVLVGNSVGSLACVIAASDSTRDLVRGLVLLNCSGGMNNKAIVDDWRIKLLLPLLWLIDFLLKQKSIASALFGRVKERHVFTAWFQLPSPLAD
ncbi:hypothetical protein VPH35_003214 [Triticum aestivum]